MANLGNGVFVQMCAGQDEINRKRAELKWLFGVLKSFAEDRRNYPKDFRSARVGFMDGPPGYPDISLSVRKVGWVELTVTLAPGDMENQNDMSLEEALKMRSLVSWLHDRADNIIDLFRQALPEFSHVRAPFETMINEFVSAAPSRTEPQP